VPNCKIFPRRESRSEAHHSATHNSYQITMALLAPIKWAQRKDSLYVTIALSDVKNEKLELTKDKLVFR
jgi:hypothetical protein